MEGLAGRRAMGSLRVDALNLLLRALMAHLHLLKSSAGLLRRFGSVEHRSASHLGAPILKREKGWPMRPDPKSYLPPASCERRWSAGSPPG